MSDEVPSMPKLRAVAKREGYALRRGRRDPDKFWLVDAATDRLMSPQQGLTIEGIWGILGTVGYRDATN
jgi:hypothetical protein